MLSKTSVRRAHEGDPVVGVVIPIAMFNYLTRHLPADLQASLLAEFDQQDDQRLVRIGRSAWYLLNWFEYT